MCKSEIFNRVLDVVSQQTEVSREQILSRSKSMEVVDARCILFRLLQEQGLYPGQIATQARKTPAAIRYLLSHFEDRVKSNKMVKIYLQNIRNASETADWHSVGK